MGNQAAPTHPDRSNHTFLYDSNWTRYCTGCPLRQTNRGGWIGLTMGTPKEIVDGE